MNYHDGATETFQEEQLFLKVLKSTTDENARWQLTGINRIQFVPIDEAEDWISTDEHLAIYEDTKNNTILYMDVPGMGVKAVGSSALATICQRTKIGGAALWKQPNEFLAKLLNECFSLFSDNTTLFYSLGKIRAAHLDYYVHLEMVEILDKLWLCIQEWKRVIDSHYISHQRPLYGMKVKIGADKCLFHMVVMGRIKPKVQKTRDAVIISFLVANRQEAA